jgi:small-conductance mechanosensitive channel
VRFDRAHFKEYGAYSLNFEIVYWIQNPDYNVYMDIQQAINLSIFKQFKERGIQFAYPTQRLFIEKDFSPEVDFSAAKKDLSAHSELV